MILRAHCFAEGAEIKPAVFSFAFKEWNVSIVTYPNKENKMLMLEISKKLTNTEIAEFKTKMDDSEDPQSFFSKRSRPLQEALTEVAQLVEGLLSIFFIGVPPKFETKIPIVNLFGENEQEINLLETDTVMRGFGFLADIKMTPVYQINDTIKDVINQAIFHLPAFSFFSQAIRSLKANDNEVAFFLFFRILDGYFSDGKKDVEKEFIKQAKELEKFLPYSSNIVHCTQSILVEMNVPSRSHENYHGLIKDIVNIRHKLTHFSATKSSFHQSAKIKFDLYALNVVLYNSCFAILRDRISKK
jgi:hypothetical protein